MFAKWTIDGVQHQFNKNWLRTIQVLRHQRGGWVGSENGKMLYSTANHQRGGWVGLRKSKT